MVFQNFTIFKLYSNLKYWYFTGELLGLGKNNVLFDNATYFIMVIYTKFNSGGMYYISF